MSNERPSGGTSPKLSTTVQKRLVIIPPVAEWMIRGIGLAIAAGAGWKQASTHVWGTHQEEAHEWQEWLFEVGPFAVAVIFAIVIIAQPAAFATWALEMMNKAGHKIVSLIPSKRRGS